jgi:hypothetical protein
MISRLNLKIAARLQKEVIQPRQPNAQQLSRNVISPVHAKETLVA